jgi:AraC-like DNA-binding protein
LNKPAIRPGTTEKVSEPTRVFADLRWYLWDGGFLALGRSGDVVPFHDHHAIQIVISLEHEMGIARDGEPWRTGRGIIVLPDVVHSFDGKRATGAMVFVDPESAEGSWLRTVVTQDVTIVPDARLESAATEIRKYLNNPLEAMGIRELVRHCVATLCAGAPPSRRLDERVTRVLRSIRDSDDLRISLETAAASVFLSPGRFQHLFKQQVGLPFRRYMLWRKLTRAMIAVGRERTLTAAAQASDFADAAHLTRTFQQMFGLPPSVMMSGECFAIESPFDVVEDAALMPSR